MSNAIIKSSTVDENGQMVISERVATQEEVEKILQLIEQEKQKRAQLINNQNDTN